MTPDLMAAIEEALADIEQLASTGRERITTGEAVNGSTALRRCYERANDARALLEREKATA